MVAAGSAHAQDARPLQTPNAPSRHPDGHWLRLQTLPPGSDRQRTHERLRKLLRRLDAAVLPSWTPAWVHMATTDLWETCRLKEARKLLSWAHEQLGSRERITLDLAETWRRMGRLQRSAQVLQTHRPQQHSHPMAWWTARTRLAATGCHWTHLHNLLDRARLLHEIDQSWAWHRQALRTDPRHPDLITAMRLQPNHPHSRMLSAERLLRMGHRKLADELLAPLTRQPGLTAPWAHALRLAYGTHDAPPPAVMGRTIETWALATLLKQAAGTPPSLKLYHRPTLLRLQQDWLDALQGQVPQARWHTLARAHHTLAAS